MATQTAGIAEELLDEPHVEGRRMSVLQLRDRVEKLGETPQAVTEEYALDVAAVYQAPRIITPTRRSLIRLKRLNTK